MWESPAQSLGRAPPGGILRPYLLPQRDPPFGGRVGPCSPSTLPRRLKLVLGRPGASWALGGLPPESIPEMGGRPLQAKGSSPRLPPPASWWTALYPGPLADVLCWYWGFPFLGGGAWRPGWAAAIWGQGRPEMFPSHWAEQSASLSLPFTFAFSILSAIAHRFFRKRSLALMGSSFTVQWSNCFLSEWNSCPRPQLPWCFRGIHARPQQESSFHARWGWIDRLSVVGVLAAVALPAYIFKPPSGCQWGRW